MPFEAAKEFFHGTLQRRRGRHCLTNSSNKTRRVKALGLRWLASATAGTSGTIASLANSCGRRRLTHSCDKADDSKQWIVEWRLGLSTRLLRASAKTMLELLAACT